MRWCGTVLATFGFIAFGVPRCADAQAETEATENDVSNFEDSASELTDKLAQLKALLDAKGDVDPDLKAKLDGLQSQLASLGLGDLGGSGYSSVPVKELQEFLTSCVGLTMKRVGASRPATIGTLKRLANGKLTPTEAATQDFWRMTATCINHLTELELQQAKGGGLQKLPNQYVEMSKKPEAEKGVLDLDQHIWKELKSVAIALVGVQEDAPKPPMIYGLIAAVPLVCVLGFLGKKFFDMQAEQDGKKNKKKRDGKKSK